jgi:hypothetical protein
MPYFSNDNVNLLLIHIPKTGGTSLEHYFSNKYNIPLNNASLYRFICNKIQEENNIKIESSLQHLTYNIIMQNKDFFNINMENINIISIVRNPYTRIISDLFWFNKININSTKEEVYDSIIIFLKNNCKVYDNHSLPQYLYVTDEDGKLVNNIKILKTENLNNDIIKLGYTDFNLKIHNFNKNNINYIDYLNNDSIKIINEYYSIDFELFNYDKM